MIYFWFEIWNLKLKFDFEISLFTNYFDCIKYHWFFVTMQCLMILTIFCHPYCTGGVVASPQTSHTTHFGLKFEIWSWLLNLKFKYLQLLCNLRGRGGKRAPPSAKVYHVGCLWNCNDFTSTVVMTNCLNCRFFCTVPCAQTQGVCTQWPGICTRWPWKFEKFSFKPLKLFVISVYWNSAKRNL